VKVWVARRREQGALIETAVPLWETAEPHELLVLDVTDQGQRRPTKVARLYPVGARKAITELIAPKLVWFKDWQFVLSGVEYFVGETGQRGLAQAWICRLACPMGVSRFKAAYMFQSGIALERRALADRFARGTAGRLLINGAFEREFGRYTTRAKIGEPVSHCSSAQLVDCSLDWMSEDRFCLSGFESNMRTGSAPSELVQQGWLCRLDLEQALNIDDARSGRLVFPQH
jgi:hypothetical protein